VTAPATATVPTRSPAPGAAQPGQAAVPPEVRRAAEEFESVFISQFLSQMKVGFGPPGPAGAAASGADDPFASMLRDEYARIVSRNGGFGLADAVMRELLRAQEVA
jgi:flagellar protein FlgJ